MDGRDGRGGRRFQEFRQQAPIEEQRRATQVLQRRAKHGQQHADRLLHATPRMLALDLVELLAHGGRKSRAAKRFRTDQVGIIHQQPVRLGRRDASRQGRRQIRFHGQLLFRTGQAGAQGVQGADAVGDGLPLAHHQLFAQQLGVFIAQPRQFQCLFQFHAQRRDIPRLLDVAVDLPLVDGLHRVLQFGIRRGQDAHDVWIAVPGVRQQLIAVGAGHALVRHQHGDALGLLVEDALALLDRGSRQYVGQRRDGALEIFEGVGLVIDIEYRRQALGRLTLSRQTQIGVNHARSLYVLENSGLPWWNCQTRWRYRGCRQTIASCGGKTPCPSPCLRCRWH